MKVISTLTGMRRAASALLAFGLSSLVLTPAYASDTEVYLRQAIDGGDPTLMMFLDSSAVMNKCMANDSDCFADYENSRIAALRNTVQNVLYGQPALKDMVVKNDSNVDVTVKNLGSVTKPAPGYIKLGYSRNNPTSNDGGWVRFPASRLDGPSPVYTGRIVVPIDRDEANEPITVLTPNPAHWDDATAIDGSATRLTLGNDAAAVRLRFQNVTIPLNAKVVSARIVFTNAEASVPAPPAVDVAIRLSTNAPYASNLTLPTIATVMTTQNNWGNIPNGNSTNTTGAASVPIVKMGTNSRVGRLDVTTMVNEVVQSSFSSQNNAAWCGGNSLSFLISEGTGSGNGNNNNWTVYSADGDSSDKKTLRPRLEVVYTLDAVNAAATCTKPIVSTVLTIKDSLDDVSWVRDSTVVKTHEALEPGVLDAENRPQYVGLRFRNVNIPAGAKIRSSYLYVTGNCNRGAITGESCLAPAPDADVPNPPTALLSVDAFNVDNLPAFCTSSLSCTPPSYSMTNALTWNTPLQRTVSAFNHAVDVKPLVESVLGRAGWASGNSLGLRIYNDPNLTNSTSYPYTSFASVSDSTAAAPYLQINYQWPTVVTNLTTGALTAREGLAADVEAFLWAEGGTPIGDAYGETARYLLGMTPRYDTTATTTFLNTLASATYKIPDLSTIKYVNGVKTYVTPTVKLPDQCKPSVSLFTMTGGTNANASNVTQNADLIIGNYNISATATPSVSSGTDNANFKAMIAVARHLASGNNQVGVKIRTDVVLFRSAGQSLTTPLVKDLMDAAEIKGGGTFYQATDESQLTAALLESLKRVIDRNGSITAPGVAVNQFNRLSHLDQLYYAVFDPPALPVTKRWTGNVKRYRLVFKDEVNSSTAMIADSRTPTPQNAVDPLSGFFVESAVSFWSDVEDGNTVDKGGAANKLPAPQSRRIFTNLGTTANDLEMVLLAGMDQAKARAAFGGVTDNQVTNLRNWLQGWKIDVSDGNGGLGADEVTVNSSTTPARKQMGGVLHSQPVLVNYGYLPTANLNDTDTNPETSENPNYNANYQDNMVFFSTMEGMVHGVDANTGVEQFAFMPRHLLPTVKDLAVEQEIAVNDLPNFGLDLTWTPWRVDADGNLKVETSNTEDRMWIFGGMRMGGRNYYALDVKNRSTPSLKWQILGGTNSATLTGSYNGAYQGLGQTWSQPVLGSIKVGNTVKTVLFVGGGYDPKHEGITYSASADTAGAWLYIIDAETGNPLFSASGTTNAGTPTLNVPDMKWSVTGSPKLFDKDQDGLVDAVYFGDLAGQVFRMDMNSAATSAGTGTYLTDIVKRVVRIANLGQFSNSPTTETVADQRRFYETPSVAIIKDGTSTWVAVALGSGNRSHPLNSATNDRFYVLKDTDVLRSDLMTATSFTVGTITPADLATVNPALIAGATMTGMKGWQMGFTRTGEKVMSKAIILLGEVMFTTYIPDTSSDAACNVVIGDSRLYRMSVLDGAASYDFNKDGTITAEDRSVGGRKGLVGEPQPFVDASGKNAILTGTGVERNRDLQTPGLRRTRWYMMQKK